MNIKKNYNGNILSRKYQKRLQCVYQEKLSCEYKKNNNNMNILSCDHQEKLSCKHSFRLKSRKLSWQYQVKRNKLLRICVLYLYAYKCKTLNRIILLSIFLEFTASPNILLTFHWLNILKYMEYYLSTLIYYLSCSIINFWVKLL